MFPRMEVEAGANATKNLSNTKNLYKNAINRRLFYQGEL